MKAFFCQGFESGMRLSTPARGYEIRKDATSLTAVASEQASEQRSVLDEGARTLIGGSTQGVSDVGESCARVRLAGRTVGDVVVAGLTYGRL